MFLNIFIMDGRLSDYTLFLFDMDGTLVKFKLDFEYLKQVTRKILEENRIQIEMKGSLIETLKELRSEFSEEEAYSEFVKKIENIVVQHEIEASEKADRKSVV